MRLVHRAYVEVEEASLHNMTRFEPLADASLASTVALGVDTLGDPSEPPLSEGVRKSVIREISPRSIVPSRRLFRLVVVTDLGSLASTDLHARVASRDPNGLAPLVVASGRLHNAKCRT